MTAFVSHALKALLNFSILSLLERWWLLESTFWIVFDFHSLNKFLSRSCLLHQVSIDSIRPEVVSSLAFSKGIVLFSRFLGPLVNNFLKLLSCIIFKLHVKICLWSINSDTSQLHGRIVLPWRNLLTPRFDTYFLRLNTLQGMALSRF